MYLFDLHCDTLTEACGRGLSLTNTALQLSIDRLPETVWAQCFAIWIPDNLRGQTAARFYDDCADFFTAQAKKYADRMTQAISYADISAATAQGKLAAILTVEGGSALAGESSRVEKLRRDGVRMLTLTWNHENEIAGGTAASPIEQGFTPFGRAVVPALERAGIILDVSHLSDKGFWELTTFAHRPFVASHSNLRSVCDHPRNLTDLQFCEIVARGGLVGLNFYPRFVSGAEQMCFSHLARHYERMLALDGEDTVALGSDFDGADMAPWLSRVEQMPALHDQFRCAFGAEQTEKLFFRNAINFFARYESQRI